MAREIGAVGLVALVLVAHSVMSRAIGGWYLGWRGIAAWILPISVNLAFRNLGWGEMSILPSMIAALGWVLISARSDRLASTPGRSSPVPVGLDEESTDDQASGSPGSYLVRSRWRDPEEISAGSPVLAADEFAARLWRQEPFDRVDMLVEGASESWVIRAKPASIPDFEVEIVRSSRVSRSEIDIDRKRVVG